MVPAVMVAPLPDSPSSQRRAQMTGGQIQGPGQEVDGFVARLRRHMAESQALGSDIEEFMGQLHTKAEEGQRLDQEIAALEGEERMANDLLGLIQTPAGGIDSERTEKKSQEEGEPEESGGQEGAVHGAGAMAGST